MQIHSKPNINLLIGILENEFNLNIPRYVDTFEEEEKVDLELASSSLKEINIQIKAVNESIESYCDELGINKPL